jgi:hypothetical protein
MRKVIGGPEPEPRTAKRGHLTELLGGPEPEPEPRTAKRGHLTELLGY